MVSHAPRVRSHDCPIAEAEFHQLIEDIWKDDRDFWWHELMKEADDKCKNIGGQWRTQKFLEGVLDTEFLKFILLANMVSSMFLLQF